MQQAAVGIIGGGILGLATAYHLSQRFPSRRVVLLEKEEGLAQHQTGHNSGVLHSGIYYKPGSLKATNCREGKKAMEAFCATEGIDYEICGKVIVATNERELPALHTIYERGQANGVRCAVIDRAHLQELEPAAAGIKALHVPETGIVNYRQVCQRLAERVPTVGIVADDCSPVALSEVLGKRGVFSWGGNSYALPVTEALGLEPGGVLRVGLLHYNTAEDVGRFLDLLPESIAAVSSGPR